MGLCFIQFGPAFRDRKIGLRETRLPSPRTKVEGGNTFSLWCYKIMYVEQYRPYKFFLSLSTRHGFGEQIGGIRYSWFMCNQYLLSSHSLTDGVVAYQIALLLQSRLRCGRVPDNGHIVPKTIGWAINADTDAHHL